MAKIYYDPDEDELIPVQKKCRKRGIEDLEDDEIAYGIGLALGLGLLK